jgi:hypothetical protein
MTDRELLKDLGPKIAEHLPGWKYCFDDDYRGSYFIPEDFAGKVRGAQSIHLGLDHKNRLHVSGSWPYGRDNACVTPSDLYIDGKRQESTSISCDSSRPPEKIAADILRRFLPSYLDLYAKCVQKSNEHCDGIDKQLAVTQEFAKIVKYTTKNAHASWYGEDCYGHVDVNWGGDSATLELRGNVEILKAALLAAVKAGALKK